MKSILSVEQRAVHDSEAPRRGESRGEVEHGMRQAPRELAFRDSGGLEVSLLWHEHEDRLTVSVYDKRLIEFFELRAPNDRALDVFHHPYAYAAQEGIEYGVATAEIADAVDA